MSATSLLRKSIVILGLVGSSHALLGQETVAPVGGEMLLVPKVAGDQVMPSMSFNAAGGVMTWQYAIADKHGQEIAGAMLASEGVARGNSFRVNKAVTGDQLQPQVQLHPINNNVVNVWESRIAGSFDIYARMSGPAKGTTFAGTNFPTVDVRMNAYLPGSQLNPVVSWLPDGGAIVAWQSMGQAKAGYYGIFAHELLANGRRAAGREFQVAQVKTYNLRNPAIATLANGNYVIAWISEFERSASTVDVYARVFTPTGTPVTDEVLINDGTSPCSGPSVAALASGGFTVVWNQKDLVTPTNGNDIFGRSFSGSGYAQGASFRINSYLYGDQYAAKIASSPSGSLVVWTSMAQDGSFEGVYGRYLSAGTQVSGDEFRVNTTTANKQLHPAVAWNGVDRFVVTWAGFTKGGFGLFGQAYVLNNSN